jgi:hypothetical protein
MKAAALGTKFVTQRLSVRQALAVTDVNIVTLNVGTVNIATVNINTVPFTKAIFTVVIVNNL